jgi:hypothetical protein
MEKKFLIEHFDTIQEKHTNQKRDAQMKVSKRLNPHVRFP